MQEKVQVDASCRIKKGGLTTGAAALITCDLLAGIWKERYLAEKKELDEKMARVGKKVRGMWESEERKKQLRSIQVIQYRALLYDCDGELKMTASNCEDKGHTFSCPVYGEQCVI